MKPDSDRWYLFRRAFRFWWQRRTRGWDDSVTWSLDTEIVAWVLPRLKCFRELSKGYPTHLTEEEWDAILNRIIVTMENYEIENLNDPHAQKNFKLFGKHFQSLWW